MLTVDTASDLRKEKKTTEIHSCKKKKTTTPACFRESLFREHIQTSCIFGIWQRLAK